MDHALLNPITVFGVVNALHHCQGTFQSTQYIMHHNLGSGPGQHISTPGASDTLDQIRTLKGNKKLFQILY
jgi:hypothetical protein